MKAGASCRLALLLAGVFFSLTAQAVDAPPEEMLKVRDPFRRPDVVAENLAATSPLERFPASDFQMIGVLTGPEKIRAMVLGPDGKSLFVAERMKIGQRHGSFVGLPRIQFSSEKKL